MNNNSLSIASNISSLRAQRQLSTATSSLSSSFERLSSGLRINKASDDAAGLSVASSLRADTRIYSQGIRNLNDGVSALNIADGALSNLSSIVTRMQELAEQAANGAVGWRQRKSLDAEAQALAKEYFRISKTTDFNGLKLLDGTVQGLSLQAGYGNSGSILSSLGGAMGTGSFGPAVSYQTETGDQFAYSAAMALADLNGDGVTDLATAGCDGGTGRATIRLGNGDGTFRKPVSYQTEENNSQALSLTDLNNDGVIDLITAGESALVGGGYATVRLGNGDGTFKNSVSFRTESTFSRSLSLSDLNSDGILDLVTAGSDGGVSRATIRLGNGDGSFRAAGSYQSGINALSLADLNGDGLLDLVTVGGTRAAIRLGNGDGTFRASLSYQMESFASQALSISDLNGDGVLDLVTAGQGGGVGRATIRLGNGDGTFNASQSYQTESNYSQALSLSDLNGDGVPDLVTAGSNGATLRLGNGDGTFRASLSYATEGVRSSALSLSDLNGDGVLDLVTAGSDGGLEDPARATIRLSNTKDGISPILPFSLKTQADALQALTVFEGTLERLSMQRGQIGAFQSRLSSALSTACSTVLEYKGAQSRVEGIDVANESASLVRHQILQQAASSVVAQASQTPSLALMLLKG